MSEPDDHRLAATLAAAAGDLLVQLRDRLLAEGCAAGEIKDRADRAAHELMVERLAAERPDDPVLSEEFRTGEGTSWVTRSSSPRVWIVDPLDGTREFGEGRSDWAVHVALVEGGEPTAGAVALPGLGAVLCTEDPPTVPPAGSRVPRILVSRTRPPVQAAAIAEDLGAELVPMGSAGAKVCAVIRGEADAYPHSGGQYEWDSAAPVAVARSAGLHCSRLDGSALEYNQENPYLPDLLVCRPELAERIIRTVEELAVTAAGDATAPGSSCSGDDSA